MSGNPRTIAELTRDLIRLGVEPGSLLMVHASLRAIGPVEAGAEGVLDALSGAVGPDGTLMMVLGAKDDWAWVNDRPESERPALLAEADPFDAATTPAEPEVGYLAEAFRLRPGTVVSNHPEGRFGARGRLARALMSDVPWNDYYGPSSPLERLVGQGGRVLRLGADIDTVTLLHLAEANVDLPSKRRVRRHRRVIGPDGPELAVVETIDDSNGIVDWPGEDYFGLILKDYLARDRAKIGTVGGARSELFEASDLLSHGVVWMRDHFR